MEYPIALGEALRLHKTSCIQAERNTAADLKHRSVLIIEESVPVIAIALRCGLYNEAPYNLAEVYARGRKKVLLTDKHGMRTTSTTHLAARREVSRIQLL